MSAHPPPRHQANNKSKPHGHGHGHGHGQRPGRHHHHHGQGRHRKPPSYLTSTKAHIRHLWGMLCSTACCASHPAETIAFLVFMPLVIGGYLLYKAKMDFEVHSGTWLEAECTIGKRWMIHWERRQSGKYEGAKNEAFKEGSFFTFEPTWNCSVRMLDGSASWLARAYVALRRAEVPACEGLIGQPMSEVQQECNAKEILYNWMPQVEFNSTLPCWVREEHADRAFLSIKEPSTFFENAVFAMLLLSIAVYSACVLLVVQVRQCRRKQVSSTLV